MPQKISLEALDKIIEERSTRVVLTEGEYTVEVVDINIDTARSSKRRKYGVQVLVLEAPNAEFEGKKTWFNFTIPHLHELQDNPYGLRYFIDFCVAAGLDIPPEVPVPPDEFAVKLRGLRLRVVTAEDTYNGRPTHKIRAVMPIDAGEPETEGDEDQQLTLF